jgi:hypothetical protein
MFHGYFEFEYEGKDKIGFFLKDPAQHFFVVHLFGEVVKVQDRNDANCVIEDPF